MPSLAQINQFVLNSKMKVSSQISAHRPFRNVPPLWARAMLVRVEAKEFILAVTVVFGALGANGFTIGAGVLAGGAANGFVLADG